MNVPSWPTWLPPLLLCLMLGACAPLPTVNSAQLLPNASPTVNGPRGTIPENRARALLAKRWPKSTINLKAQAALEEAATGVPLIAGNKVSLLFDGPQTLTAMIEAIDNAKDHINLETYIFDQDELGLKFADSLIEKRKQGIDVNILYDSVGTIGTPKAFFERMREAGIRLVEFNPINPATRAGKWEPNNRDHRKIMIVDGKLAFTGGVNISATYSNSSLFRSKTRPVSNDKVGWRDTHVKIEGPAVAALQWVFIQGWVSQDAGDLPERAYFPPLRPMGDKIVRVLASEPGGEYQIYKAYVLAIQEAKTSIHITSAYFVPDEQIVDALTGAAGRGLDVKIILPGVSDSGLVFHAGHSFFDRLLDGGVKIHQLQVAVLHAKTAVIDGNWSTVGSTNIDMRSFMHNSELNVVVVGDSFGAEMESAFKEDLSGSVEVTPEQWANRPVADRVKEWTARILGYWL